MSLTHAYRICDLALSSNIALPELSPAKVLAVECRFELLPPGDPRPAISPGFTIGLLRKATRGKSAKKPGPISPVPVMAICCASLPVEISSFLRMQLKFNAVLCRAYQR